MGNKLKVYMEDWGFRIVPIEEQIEGNNEYYDRDIEDELKEIFDSLDFNDEDSIE